VNALDTIVVNWSAERVLCLLHIERQKSVRWGCVFDGTHRFSSGMSKQGQVSRKSTAALAGYCNFASAQNFNRTISRPRDEKKQWLKVNTVTWQASFASPRKLKRSFWSLSTAKMARDSVSTREAELANSYPRSYAGLRTTSQVIDSRAQSRLPDKLQDPFTVRLPDSAY
jgi:hypothetical protein